MSLFSHIAANSVAEVGGALIGKRALLQFEDVKDGRAFCSSQPENENMSLMGPCVYFRVDSLSLKTGIFF